jgi:hypothetical protein
MSAGLRKNLAAGTQVWIALAGATLSLPGSVIVAAGDSTSYTAVGRTAKPVYNDTSWVSIPAIESFELSVDNGQGIEVFEPSPGAIELVDVLRVGRKTMVKLTSQTTQPINWQLLLRSTPLNNTSTNFTPFSVPSEVYCWLKAQVYDNANNLYWSADLFCELILNSALKFDPKALTKPEYQGTVLTSALNAAAFA